MAYEVNDRDVRFVLYEQLGVEKLVEFPRFSDYSKEDFDMIFDGAAKLAKEVLAPINKASDEVGAVFENGKVIMPEGFKSAYNALAEGGWFGLAGSVEYGGQGLPISIYMPAHEFFTGAACAFNLTLGLTSSAAAVIVNFGSEDSKKTFCEKMYSGQWSGTMCLTEPQAGSDVGANKAQAVKIDGTQDRYLITGTKCFISSGDHDLAENIVHLVLARVPDAPPGTRGISLFIVPKYRVNPDGSLGDFNDVNCSGIEHKMGIKGSPTCTLNFGDDGKCEGILIGEENKGIRYMFQMMNEERVAVGLQGVALGSASYLSALEYAKERIQSPHITRMREKGAPSVPIIEHPDVRRMLLTMKAYVEGCRSLLYTTAYFEDMIKVLEDDEKRTLYQGYVDLLTPICKAYSSDTGFRVCELGVQVLGGYGYCSEYENEQYLRDEKIGSIYEGTNGIQALDLLGRKVAMKGGMLFMSYIQRLNDFIEKYKDHPSLSKYIADLDAAKNTLTEITMSFGEMSMSGNPIYPVLNATPYLELFSEVVVGQLLIDQAVIADEKLKPYLEKAGDPESLRKLAGENDEVKFYLGKIETAKFFITQILPGVKAKAEAIKSENTSPLDIVF